MQSKDEELVASVLQGERDRFGDLVDRYQGRLVNYLLRMVGNVQDAHDLAQDVFMKVYAALDRFDDQYRFSTWLFRVAQNAAIDQIRKRRLKLVSINRADKDDEGGGDWDLPSPGLTPYQETRNVERGIAIRDAIENLPDEYRDLIELRHYAELSYDEIAQLKSMPLGTVKNKLFRGRQMLKEKLTEFLQE